MALTQVKTLGIADDAVTTDKMQHSTDGTIITYDANQVPVHIGPGNDGQVLTSQGAGSYPQFETPAASPITALNNATANELVTVGSTTTELDAESTLTYDGTELKIGGDSGVTGTFHVEAYNGSGACYNIIAGTQGAGLYIADTGSSEKLGLLANGQASISSYKNGDPMVFSTTDGSGTAERLRIDSSGNIWLNGNGSYNTDRQVFNADGTSGLVEATNELNIFQNKSSSGGLYIGYKDIANGGTITDYHFCNGTGGDTKANIYCANVAVASGNGIDFSATAGPAAGSGTQELLDDYEEGSWTPIVVFASTAASGQSTTGHYVKIGRMVYAAYRFTLTNKGSGSGEFSLEGFPFAPQNAYSDIASGIGYSHRFADTDNDSGQVEAQFYSSIMYLAYRGLNGNTTRLTDSNCRDDMALSGMIIYYTTA